MKKTEDEGKEGSRSSDTDGEDLYPDPEDYGGGGQSNFLVGFIYGREP
jgi:hypothetical protein